MTDSRTPSPDLVANPTVDPAGELLIGAGVPAVTIGALVSMGSLFAGPSQAVSCVLGALLAIAALAAGPVLLRIGRSYSPPGLMALAVCGYGFVVLLLGLAFLLVSEASWLAGGYAAIGALAVVAAWLAGQARSTSRLRILSYGDVQTSSTEAVVGPQADQETGPAPVRGKEGQGLSR